MSFQPKDPSQDGHNKDQNYSHNNSHGLQPRQMGRRMGRSMNRFGSGEFSNTHLYSNVQAKMENAFQEDFSDVEVTKDSDEATQMGAQAFAQGNKIHFAPGNYKPQSTEGQELISHELPHVVQQKQGRVKATTQAKGAPVNDDPALENEADVMGEKAVSENQAVLQKQKESESELAQQSIINESGGLIKVTIYDAIHNAYEKEISRDIEGIRNYIVSNYNWNAIIKIMKFAASKVENFDYSSPTNLQGTTEDNSIIIPKQGVLAIISTQLQEAMAQNGCNVTSENKDAILALIDGLPGAGFATIMGEDSQNTLRDEEGNDSMLREDGTEIDIPDFSSDSEETLYDFMRDITLARNGLWSDDKDIVNLTGLRRELEITEETDHLVQWNDTMAASWIEEDDDCNEVKRCRHYTATTEPGNRDANRMMTPQTATVLLGLHQGRQSAGRVMSPLLKGSDSDGNIYDFDNNNWAGINIHPGGIIDSQRGGMGVDRNKLSGLPGSYGALSDNFNVQLSLSEIFFILSKYGKDRDESAFNYLKEKADEAEQLRKDEIEITNEQKQVISDYRKLKELLEEDQLSSEHITYLKNTITYDAELEESILDGLKDKYSISELNDGSNEISGNKPGARVAASSEGCQVVFGGKEFYEYWWNATGKSGESGQRRWYYSLINLTDPYNDIELEKGNL